MWLFLLGRLSYKHRKLEAPMAPLWDETGIQNWHFLGHHSFLVVSPVPLPSPAIPQTCGQDFFSPLLEPFSFQSPLLSTGSLSKHLHPAMNFTGAFASLICP